MCNWLKLVYIFSLAISLSFASDGICIGEENCLENEVESDEHLNRYDEGNRNIIYCDKHSNVSFSTRYPPPNILN